MACTTDETTRATAALDCSHGRRLVVCRKASRALLYAEVRPDMIKGSAREGRVLQIREIR